MAHRGAEGATATGVVAPEVARSRHSLEKHVVAAGAPRQDNIDLQGRCIMRLAGKA